MHFDPAELHLKSTIIDGLIWDAETGVDEWERGNVAAFNLTVQKDVVGGLAPTLAYLSDDEETLSAWQEWLKNVQGSRVDARILTAREAGELFSSSARKWCGALYSPTDGVAEPEMAVPALAQAAQKAGVAVVTGCAALDLEKCAGRISAVATERGVIRCDAVVLAAGAWSRLFCMQLGIRLPVLKVLGSAMRTAPVDGPLPGGWAKGLAFRKRLDGGYTIS